MTDTTDNGYHKETKNSKILENVWYKSVRLVINLLINILLFFTVFICLFFCFSARLDWHIILCVLGYQFFMFQGTLMMSPYNSWSMFMARRYKKHMHWVMQVVAAALVTAGTVIIIRQKSVHFNTIHGKLGLAAMVCCLLSLLNGILAMYPTKLSSCIGVFWIRFFHYITGLVSMFTATGSLCAGYKYRSFSNWTGNGDVFVPTLIGITWIFTILVSLDFWIITGNKIRSLVSKQQ